MTEKQIMFCKEFLVDFNATQAAIRAGYSEKTAYSIASENLRKPEIQAQIKLEIKLRQERTGKTADDVLNEIELLAFSDLSDYLTIDEAGSVVMKMLQEMEGIKSRAIRSITEDRVIKTTPGKEDKPDSEITVHDKLKYTLHSKERMLELLAKHHGLVVDRLNVSGSLTHKHKLDMQELRNAYNNLRKRKKKKK
jgi:phage terminase small subunit